MHVKFRSVDGAHSAFASTDNETALAATVTIESPEKNLLTQSEVYAAEGGAIGTALQFGGAVAGAAVLFAYKPTTLLYLKRAQLGWCGWTFLAGSVTAGHYVGHTLGVQMFGNSQALHNHWVAYHYVKTCNRYEGRQVLAKPGRY